MRVDLIQKYKEAYSNYLQESMINNEPYEPGYKWDAIATWKERYDPDAADLERAFAQSLYNPHSGRLWGGELHSAKSGIIMLARQNPLLMRIAFADLFDESKDISMRINRFNFHCDEVLIDLHGKDERINTHFQSDYSASLYLSLEYPESYGLFDYPAFHKFMKLIDSRNIPVEQDKERYFKSLNALYTVISKDQEFMNGFQFLMRDRLFTGRSLFMINDLIRYSVGEPIS